MKTTVSLYDALEICLQALQQGADVESCLARFPAAQAEELRPILETANQARYAAVAEIPEAALRRGKARVLQAAAELREQSSVSTPNRRWNLSRIFGLSLLSLAMMFCLLVTGWVGLVRAAEGSLPGDALYPVKRGWEDARLFVASPATRAELETEFQQERVREVNELFRASRVEQVIFQGVVAAKNATLWNISGLLVIVTDQTQVEGEILPGARVQVWGQTSDGFISAATIRLLTAPSVTPTPLLSPTSQPTLTPTPQSTPHETRTPTAPFQPTTSPQPTLTMTPFNPFPSQTPIPPDNGNDNDNSNDDDDDDDDDDNGNDD